MKLRCSCPNRSPPRHPIAGRMHRSPIIGQGVASRGHQAFTQLMIRPLSLNTLTIRTVSSATAFWAWSVLAPQ